MLVWTNTTMTLLVYPSNPVCIWVFILHLCIEMFEHGRFRKKIRSLGLINHPVQAVHMFTGDDLPPIPGNIFLYSV